MLYVSHNMNTIRQLCDRCVVLDKGRVVFEGDVEEAIGVYIGTMGSLQNQYKYTREYHQSKKNCGTFMLDGLEIRNSTDNRFDCGSILELVLNCHATQVWNDIKLRFEIQYQDGSNVGTMLTKNAFYVNRNEFKQIHLKMDTGHLTPGRYKVDIIAYIDNEFGAEQLLDGVYPGFVFEMNDTINSENPITWLHGCWGHIHLHDVIIG